MVPVGNMEAQACFSSRPSVVSWFIAKQFSQCFSPHTAIDVAALQESTKIELEHTIQIDEINPSKRQKQARIQNSLENVPSKSENCIKGQNVLVEPSSKSISAATPSYCRQLLSKKITDPNGGPPVYPYVIQMMGSSNPYYIGCPVEVRVKSDEQLWVKGMISSIASATDSGQHIILNDGSDVYISDLQNSVRPDYESCGRYSIGRHAQVLFECGTWYVGVVVHLAKCSNPAPSNQIQNRDCIGQKRRGKTIVRVVFEDGDRVEAVAGDCGVMLLPTEWSDHVADTGIWGWWGFNKDRIKNCLDVGKETWTVCMAPARSRTNITTLPKGKECLMSDTSAIKSVGHVKKQRREVSRQQGCVSSGDSLPEAISLFQTLVPNSWEPGSCIHAYLVQMRGSCSKYYVGCPVECREAENSTWEKGTVVVSKEDKNVEVVLRSGRRIQVDSVEGDGKKIRSDGMFCGRFAVGRHAQVLFEDGFWYVGIVIGTFGSGREPNFARIRFEDGEEVEVTIGEMDVMLLPQEWSDVVASAGAWGWWGYNVDRVKLCRVHGTPSSASRDQGPLKTSLKRKAAPKSLSPPDKEQNDAAAPKKQVGTRVKRRAVAISPPTIAPPPPTGIARLSAFMHVEKSGHGCSGSLQIPKKHVGDDSDSDDDDVKGSQQMNPLALAVTLCDSLRSAAFVDGWDDCGPRTKWKERICKFATDWKHFGAQLRIFEGKIARSATLPAYAAARPALIEVLGEVMDEEVARHCVQLLAGQSCRAFIRGTCLVTELISR